MGDRIPGSCYENPIWYRDYRIYIAEAYTRHVYQYIHDDYDGTDDGGDYRYGHADTIQACKIAIDELEDDQ